MPSLIAAAGLESEAHGDSPADPLAEEVSAIHGACVRVNGLLEKVQSTLGRVRVEVAPEASADTIPQMVDALAPKGNGEDPVDAAVQKQVMTGAKSVFTMLLLHGVKCDFEKITTTHPKGDDGRFLSASGFLEDAQQHALRLLDSIAKHKAERRAAREQRHAKKHSSSSKAPSSAA